MSSAPKRRPPHVRRAQEPGSPITPQLRDPASNAGLHLLCLAAGASPVPSPPPQPRAAHAPHAHVVAPPPFAYAPPHYSHLGFVASPTYVAAAPPAYMPPYAAYAYSSPPVYGVRVAASAPAAGAARAASVPDVDAARKVKGPWRKEEDALLTALVARYGARRWTAIAAHIPGRTGKQARERWLNQLSPDLAKRAWSPAEDRVVMEAHARLGNRWSEIAKLLKGRTDNAVKNRFNTTIRRQIAEIAHHARRSIPPPASPTSSSEGAARKRPRGADTRSPRAQRVKVGAISA